MMLFLSKLLPLFVYPVGLACGLIFASLVAQWLRWRAVSMSAALLALAVLWLSSAPVIANLAYSALESRYPPAEIASLRQADVAILLGGSVTPPRPPLLLPELDDPVDRVWQTARLFNAGKVRRILVSGGNLPWRTAAPSEAEATVDLLANLGVPREAIVIESRSRNTHENARFSRPVWEREGFATGYLVTSAAHMPRALAVFRKAGFAVDAVATDYQVSHPIADSVLDLLPSHAGLVLTTQAMKEALGILVYKWRGWI